LVLVSILTFIAFNLIPGNPARVILGVDASEAQVEALSEELGLNKNMGERYVSWLGGVVSGDVGDSIKYKEPILGMISQRLPITFSLAILALIFTIIIAVPLALLAAWKEKSFLGRFITSAMSVCISIPEFFLGVIFIWIFGLILRLFTAGAYVAYQEDFGGFISYLILPSLAIAIPSAAMLVRYLYNSISQQMKLLYVRTAQSVGNRSWRVLSKHVLKNASIPAITMLGMIVSDIFSGSIIIEQVFSIPGIGRLLISAIESRDFPLLQTIVIYIAIVVIVANTLVDIAIQAVDPRIRIS
jgi:ABC-type dipeptide/oligopeptide/nickel transport system permease component